MNTFRFLPPSVEDQRAFLTQLGGGLLGLAVCGFLIWRSPDAGLRAILIGAGLGIIFMVGRNAWQLELKAARSQNGGLSIDENGFTVIDGHKKSMVISWESVTNMDVKGGKLLINWLDKDGAKHQMELGARELEDGMQAMQLLAARGKTTDTAPGGFLPPTSFISLEAKD